MLARKFIVLFGGHGTPVDPLAPGAPSTPDLQAASDSSVTTDNYTNDNTPTFDVVWPAGYFDVRDAVAGDGYDMQVYDNPGFSGSPTGTLTGDVSGASSSLTVSSPLSDGTYYNRVNVTRTSHNGPYSGTLTFTVDTVAPTLSSPIGSQLAQTTAAIGVSTNEATGTLYYVVTTSSTAPTAARVKLGQNDAGTAALYAGNQVIASTGAKTATATGITNGTRYAYFMHEDLAGNQSSVTANTTTWTQADITAPVLSSAGSSSVAGTTATVSVTTDEGNGLLYAVVTTLSSLPSAAQIKAGKDSAGATAAFAANSGSGQSVSGTGVQNVSATGLTQSTAYYAHFYQEDTALNGSNRVSSLVFTTTSSSPDIALIAHGKASFTGASTGCSVTLDTTGANFVVIKVVRDSGGTGAAVTDNKGNGTPTALTETTTNAPRTRLHYFTNPTVGSSHIFSFACTNGFGEMEVAAFSNVATSSPQEAEATANGTGTAPSAGAGITPAQNGELVIAAVGFSGVVTANSINGSLTILDSETTVAGQHYGGAMAYLVQPTAALIDPDWALSASSPFGAVIACFKKAP